MGYLKGQWLIFDGPSIDCIRKEMPRSIILMLKRDLEYIGVQAVEMRECSFQITNDSVAIQGSAIDPFARVIVPWKGEYKPSVPLPDKGFVNFL